MTITYPPELLPTEDDAEVIADCDACGQKRPVTRAWALGHMECFVCEECRQ
jgi:hypothetical protein